MTTAQAQQKVSRFDLADFQNAVQQMESENLPSESKSRLAAIAVTAGMSVGMMLNGLIGLSLVKLTSRQQSAFHQRFADDYKQEVHLQNSSGFVKQQLLRQVEPAIKSDGAKLNTNDSFQYSAKPSSVITDEINVNQWSDNLWTNRDQLANQVQNAVNQVIKHGMTLDDVNKQLFPYLKANQSNNTSITGALKQNKSAANRLLRSESQRLIDHADMTTFKIHADQYKQEHTHSKIMIAIITEEDGSVCDLCQEIADAGPYDPDECPDLPDDTHPYCRCHKQEVIVQVSDDE